MNNDDLDEFDKLLDRASAHFSQQQVRPHTVVDEKDNIGL